MRVSSRRVMRFAWYCARGVADRQPGIADWLISFIPVSAESRRNAFEETSILARQFMAARILASMSSAILTPNRRSLAPLQRGRSRSCYPFSLVAHGRQRLSPARA